MKKNQNTDYLDRVLESNSKLTQLLEKEKTNRNVESDAVVFVGASNLAKYYWCAEQSYLKSKNDELMFFGSYLYDRITYSLRLGNIDTISQSDDKLLEVGDDIKLKDVESLLSAEKIEKHPENILTSNHAKPGEWRGLGTIRGRAYVLGFPDKNVESLTRKQVEVSEVVFVDSTSSPDLHPLLRGVSDEESYSERYPTIRWNFQKDDYVIVGVPDDITKEFVYEYKSTKNTFLKSFLKPVAMTQADIYGYFFNRKEKRVQLRVLETGLTETVQNPIDTQRVIDTISGFRNVANSIRPIPPKAWKCKVCEFKDTCTISQSS